MSRAVARTTKWGRSRPQLAAIVDAAAERDVLVHVDACMAAGHVPLDFAAMGADLCSVTGHKLGAPTGAAALLVRRGLARPALRRGRRSGASTPRWHRERRRRSSASAPPPPSSATATASEREADRAAGAHGSPRCRSHSASTASQHFGDPDERVPHLVCLGIHDVEAEPVLLALDQRGIAGALRIVVLERGARALARPRRDGRRRRQVARVRAWVGTRPTTTSTPSSTRSPRSLPRCASLRG